MENNLLFDERITHALGCAALHYKLKNDNDAADKYVALLAEIKSLKEGKNMRISHVEKKEPRLIGEFNLVPIYEAEKCEERMDLTKENFQIISEIIDGFLRMGRDEIPDLSKKVNDLLKAKQTDVRYIGSESGVYQYKIIHGKAEIVFTIEPALVPIYNYVVRDMLRREKTLPVPSPATGAAEGYYSPIVSVDDAIKKISEITSQKKGEIIEKEGIGK